MKITKRFLHFDGRRATFSRYYIGFPFYKIDKSIDEFDINSLKSQGFIEAPYDWIGEAFDNFICSQCDNEAQEEIMFRRAIEQCKPKSILACLIDLF